MSNNLFYFLSVYFLPLVQFWNCIKYNNNTTQKNIVSKSFKNILGYGRFLSLSVVALIPAVSLKYYDRGLK